MNHIPTLSLLVTIALLILTGCSRNQPEHSETQPAPMRSSVPVAEVAGLQWSVPSEWQVEAQRPMRVATYSTPAAEGDTDRGEVAIFYFGPGEGGSVDANVERWLGQFEQPDGRSTREVAERETYRINDIPITIVTTTGTYTAAAGPMAPRQDIRAGYKLIGAIAEGPQGAVFFKFTGPENTVDAQSENFMKMIHSIRQH